MKLFILTALILLGLAITPAQEKTITQKEFDDAWKTAYSNALRVTENRSRRTRKEGRKGFDGDAASISHAVELRETAVGPGLTLRETFQLSENGSTTKSVTIARPAVGKAGWDYIALDEATGLWKPSGRPVSPIQGFKYVTVPGERSGSEKVFSRSDVFKFMGTSTVNGKPVKIYLHKHVRDFTLEGGVGSYYTEIKYTFAEDGSYFKGENYTIRKGPKDSGFASISDELEAAPSLKIDMPAVKAQPSPTK